MNNVVLRELPATDPFVKYARVVGDNKIKHYKVGYVTTMFYEPLDLIKAAIEKEEGPTNIEVARANVVYNQVVMPVPILDEHPEIKTALMSRRCNDFIYQDFKMFSPNKKQMLYNIYSRAYNFVASLINKTVFSHEYNLSPVKILRIKMKPVFIKQLLRRVNPVTFLSVAFESGMEDQAVKLLVNDLKRLCDNGLILAHQTMPNMTLVSDTVGSGKNRFVISCNVFLDGEKVVKIARSNSPAYPEQALDLKTVAREGGIGLTLETPYDIEIVEIANPDEEKNKKDVLDAYSQSVPLVNNISREMKKFMKELNYK